MEPTQDRMKTVHDHFLDSAQVWRAYNAGEIGVLKREALLWPLRRELPSLPYQFGHGALNPDEVTGPQFRGGEVRPVLRADRWSAY